jgi:hypothetical protein
MKTPVSRNNPPLTYTGTLVLIPASFEMIGAAMPQTYDTVLNNPLAVARTVAGKDSGVYAYYLNRQVSHNIHEIQSSVDKYRADFKAPT